MITFLKIAWRNIIRNKKRSLITISAVGFGLGALIFIWSFIEGAHRQMIENYTSLLSGHIQIHSKGYHQNPKLENYITDGDAILSQLKKIPEIKAAASRVKAVGLVSSSESSSGIMILGVAPEKEITVSTINKRLKQGEFLKQDSDKDILIGSPLAKNLNVEIGDKIVIMSQAIDGSIAAGAYYIKGLFDTGTDEIDKGLALITKKAAQDLFVMDNKVSEITIRLKDASLSEELSKKISGSLNSDKIEILSWQEISPSLEQWINFDNTFMFILVLIIMIIVAIGILNTVLMGVLERTREFGILLALGTKRKEILTMVAWESFFLGLIGIVFGITLGIFLSFYFGKTGINLTIFSSALSSFYMDPVIFPRLNLNFTAISALLIMIISCVVSIYPALHAANLKPVDAIRSI